MTVRIINADVMDGLAQLADESVHCVVTSPPYWGLRDYGVDGQIGLEPTLAEHIDRLVQVFREVRRVLRSDGTLWLNYGDGYANDGKWGDSTSGLHATDLHGSAGLGRQKISTGLKPKDLLMLPARLAIALQDDGWWVRSDIIWHKTAPMPESVTDRPTKSHEHIFLLTKSPRYFFDAEAVKESAVSDHPSGNGFKREARLSYQNADGSPRGNDQQWNDVGGSRNIRDVWTINPEPFDGEFCTACGRYYDGAEKRQIRVKDGKRYCRCGQHDAWLSHFAVFPSKLVEKCILAGTSEKGCCAECGAPWVRETQVRYDNPGNRKTNGTRSLANRDITAGFAQRLEKRTETTGWRPSCTCNADVVSCTVLDPFGGSGTTGLVADRLQRNAILIELNPQYAEMARNRIEKEAGLFTQVQMTAPAPAQAEHPHEPYLLSLMEAAE